jgi:hypothetical protein
VQRGAAGDGRQRGAAAARHRVVRLGTGKLRRRGLAWVCWPATSGGLQCATAALKPVGPSPAVPSTARRRPFRRAHGLHHPRHGSSIAAVALPVILCAWSRQQGPLKPIGYNGSYLACRIGHFVPIYWSPPACGARMRACLSVQVPVPRAQCLSVRLPVGLLTCQSLPTASHTCLSVRLPVGLFICQSQPTVPHTRVLIWLSAQVPLPAAGRGAAGGGTPALGPGARVAGAKPWPQQGAHACAAWQFHAGAGQVL